MVPISHPDLLLGALPHNIGVLSWVSLLLSYHGKGKLSLRIFSHLEKVVIIFNLVKRLTFRLVCIILYCSVVAGIFRG